MKFPDNTIHQPSKIQAIGFFIFTLCVAGFVFAWFLFLNKGRVEIEGEFPFSVSIGSEEKTCSAKPCTFSLTPRSYTAILKKKGFFDDEKAVRVLRGQTTVIRSKFQFIPTVTEVKSRPLFWGNSNVDKDHLLVITKSSVGVQDLKTGKSITTGISPTMLPVWAGSDVAYLEHKDEKDSINLWNSGTPKQVAVFVRPLKDPTLMSSASGEFLVVIETADDKSQTYYLVNTKENTRKSLILPISAQNLHVVGKTLFYETVENDFKHVMGLDLANAAQTTYQIPALDSENIIEKSPDVFIFFSAQNQQTKSSSNLGPAISDVITDVENSTSQNLPETSLFLTQYSKETESFKTLVTIPLKDKDEVHNLTLDPNGSRIYFEKGGKVFVVELDSPGKT